MSARDSGDLDPVEPQEWLDTLSAVQQHRGAGRANFVVNALVGAARRDRRYIPHSLNTPYCNTIPPEQEAKSPWAGKTEEQCKAEGIKFGKAVFPWAASGRAIANDARRIDRHDGRGVRRRVHRPAAPKEEVT